MMEFNRHWFSFKTESYGLTKVDVDESVNSWDEYLIVSGQCVHRGSRWLFPVTRGLTWVFPSYFWAFTIDLVSSWGYALINEEFKGHMCSEG